MIIIFEGQDGVGKSTLLKSVAKAREYQDTYVHRLFPSDIIYAAKFERHTIDQKLKEMRRFNKLIKPFYVFVNADVKDVIKTHRKRKEKFILDQVEQENYAFSNFGEVVLKEYPGKVNIGRTGKTIEETTLAIVKAIRKYEKTLH